jgi:quinol monooxygenase YgiN
MNSPLVIIAQALAGPGFEQQLIDAQKRLVEAARKSPGCLRYELNVSAEDSRHIVFVEQWASTADWQRHMAGPHINTFRNTAGHLIADFSLLQMTQVA